MSSREVPSLPKDNMKSKGFGKDTDLKFENLTILHSLSNLLKSRPNDRNISTQHIATCCARLATMLRCVATCWVLLVQIKDGQIFRTTFLGFA